MVISQPNIAHESAGKEWEYGAMEAAEAEAYNATPSQSLSVTRSKWARASALRFHVELSARTFTAECDCERTQSWRAIAVWTETAL